MKIIKLNSEARLLLRQGVDAVADVVKTTLGPRGRNVVLGKLYTQPVITNDGVSIAREIELEDEVANTGAQIIKEASIKTNERVGDGTTTSTVIAQAIIHEGLNRLADEDSLLKSATNPMQIKRDIDESCKLVCDELKSMARPITTPEEIAKVATVSVESEHYGKMLSEIICKIGKDGVITVKESESISVDYEVVSGLEIPHGYVSSYMATNDRAEGIVENAKVLVTNLNIDNVNSLVPVIEQLAKEGRRDLVVVAGGASEQVVATLVVNRLKQTFNVTLIKCPNILKDETLGDVAAVVGAKLIDSRAKQKLEEVVLSDLGTCDRVIATADKTTFVGGEGDIAERQKHIQRKLEEANTQMDKERLEERLAKLKGGVAVINVGAPTETERTYLKLKLDDAVCAVKAAIAEGVVPGAGLALKMVAEKLPENILTEAIKSPYRQIRENAGEELEVDDTVVDPVKVTRIALENACSVAGVLLTTEAVVVPKREREKEN